MRAIYPVMCEERHRDWRSGLPVLIGARVHLREPSGSDAPSLFEEICAGEVTRYLPPAPASVEAVEQTLRRTIEWRRDGRGFCFVVLPPALDRPVGMMQFLLSRDRWVRASLHRTWEWGFALGRDYWGTGTFGAAATLALEFAFTTVGVPRLDAWVVEDNARANAAMARLGAERRAFHGVVSPDGRHGNFVRWTLRRAERHGNPLY